MATAGDHAAREELSLQLQALQLIAQADTGTYRYLPPPQPVDTEGASIAAPIPPVFVSESEPSKKRRSDAISSSFPGSTSDATEQHVPRRQRLEERIIPLSGGAERTVCTLHTVHRDSSLHSEKFDGADDDDGDNGSSGEVDQIIVRIPATAFACQFGSASLDAATVHTTATALLAQAQARALVETQRVLGKLGIYVSLLAAPVSQPNNLARRRQDGKETFVPHQNMSGSRVLSTATHVVEEDALAGGRKRSHAESAVSTRAHSRTRDGTVSKLPREDHSCVSFGEDSSSNGRGSNDYSWSRQKRLVPDTCEHRGPTGISCGAEVSHSCEPLQSADAAAASHLPQAALNHAARPFVPSRPFPRAASEEAGSACISGTGTGENDGSIESAGNAFEPQVEEGRVETALGSPHNVALLISERPASAAEILATAVLPSATDSWTTVAAINAAAGFDTTNNGYAVSSPVAAPAVTRSAPHVLLPLQPRVFPARSAATAIPGATAATASVSSATLVSVGVVEVGTPALASGRESSGDGACGSGVLSVPLLEKEGVVDPAARLALATAERACVLCLSPWLALLQLPFTAEAAASAASAAEVGQFRGGGGGRDACTLLFNLCSVYGFVRVVALVSVASWAASAARPATEEASSSVPPSAVALVVYASPLQAAAAAALLDGALICMPAAPDCSGGGCSDIVGSPVVAEVLGADPAPSGGGRLLGGGGGRVSAVRLASAAFIDNLGVASELLSSSSAAAASGSAAAPAFTATPTTAASAATLTTGAAGPHEMVLLAAADFSRLAAMQREWEQPQQQQQSSGNGGVAAAAAALASAAGPPRHACAPSALLHVANLPERPAAAAPLPQPPPSDSSPAGGAATPAAAPLTGDSGGKGGGGGGCEAAATAYPHLEALEGALHARFSRLGPVQAVRFPSASGRQAYVHMGSPAAAAAALMALHNTRVGARLVKVSFSDNAQGAGRRVRGGQSRAQHLPGRGGATPQK